MIKPVKMPVKEKDGTFVIFQPDKSHLVYQTLYFCPKCKNTAVGGWAIGQTIHCNVEREEKCPTCGNRMDWAAIDIDEENSDKAFDEWFNKHATNGSLTMLNEEGTGYLQTKQKRECSKSECNT